MLERKPTIKDVARRAGVCFKTVSRVINDQQGVRPEIRLRVRQAISELGYVVNFSARSLASGRSRNIGVVIPRITDPHTFELLQHIGQVSEKQKVGVIILTRLTLSDELSVSNFVGHGLVGSLLLISVRNIGAYLPVLKALQVPTMVCESPYVSEDGEMQCLDVACVASDNRGGAFAAVDYLIGLGHRRIGYVGGSDLGQNRLRYLGYRDALLRHGLDLHPQHVQGGGWSWESGHEKASLLLSLSHRPTALFCASDNIALGAMRAAMDRGLRVPADLSVVGFDDISAAALSHPGLTTIRQPNAEMVRMAIDQLIRQMDGEQIAPSVHLLATALVERESCSPPAIEEPILPP